MSSHQSQRAVIIGGVRTPFLKRRSGFEAMSALELGKICVAELIQRYGIGIAEVDGIIYGEAVPSLRAPNIAREVGLGMGLPPQTDAFSLTRACATGYQTTISAVQQIEHGGSNCIIAGGADSTSLVPLAFPEHLTQSVLEFEDAGNMQERVEVLKHFKISDLKPETPQIRELSTGLTMGQSAEVMAKKNGISRKEQDDYAHQSHVKAANAWKSGKFDGEVMCVYPEPNHEHFAKRDGSVRFDSERSKYDELPPVFDKKHGTITAGNSCPLSDGASAVLLASEAYARRKGLPILGRIASYAFAAVDPFDQLLIGPAYSAPEAVRKAGLQWDDMSLFDLHEAFAAQMLSVLKAMPIPNEKLNVNGGSIALGHPFAATGGRQITQTLNELHRRRERFALCGACAAGGLSAAVVLEALQEAA